MLPVPASRSILGWPGSPHHLKSGLWKLTLPGLPGCWIGRSERRCHQTQPQARGFCALAWIILHHKMITICITPPAAPTTKVTRPTQTNANTTNTSTNTTTSTYQYQDHHNNSNINTNINTNTNTLSTPPTQTLPCMEVGWAREETLTTIWPPCAPSPKHSSTSTPTPPTTKTQSLPCMKVRWAREEMLTS